MFYHRIMDSNDSILIKNILEKQCNESLKKLIDKHSGMIFNIGKKYCSCNSHLDINELNDNKYWIIFNAIKSFDTQKGSKFSTWLGNQTRFFCLNYNNKNKKYTSTEDSVLEYLINQSNTKNIDNRKELINTIVDLFHQITDPNTKNAIYYRYFHNKERILNYSEIAQILNVTPQTVLNWHNKFIKFVKKKLTKTSKLSNI